MIQDKLPAKQPKKRKAPKSPGRPKTNTLSTTKPGKPLNTKQKTIVLLHNNGVPKEIIAELLNTTKNNVTQTVNKAKQTGENVVAVYINDIQALITNLLTNNRKFEADIMTEYIKESNKETVDDKRLSVLRKEIREGSKTVADCLSKMGGVATLLSGEKGSHDHTPTQDSPKTGLLTYDANDKERIKKDIRASQARLGAWMAKEDLKDSAGSEAVADDSVSRETSSDGVDNKVLDAESEVLDD